MLKNRTFFDTVSSPIVFGAVAVALCAIFLALPGCGAPTPDTASANGKQQILDEVDVALTNENCALAVSKISDLYNSSYTDNQVRLKMASAYGCDAGVNFFKMMGEMVSNASVLGSPGGFWTEATRMFPSATGSDYKVEGALLAAEALQASLKTGALVLPNYQVNPGTYNVGSVLSADRTDDSNIYLIFTSMAAIGSIQNRQGADATTHHKSAALPWTTATDVDTTGCAYAASILNFVDAANASQSAVNSSLGSVLGTISSSFSTLLDEACDYGCQGTAAAGVPVELNTSGGWVATGCSFPAGTCGTCPVELRDRTKCAQAASDKVSCAAAGIVNFVNNSAVGWP